MPPSDVLSYTHKVSPTWLPKHELNRDHIRHGKVDGRNPRRPQSYTENYRYLRNVESKRNSFPQGRTHQLVIQY